MATLSKISLQLEIQNDIQEKQSKDIDLLRKDFSNYFSFLKQSKLDDLENEREKKKNASPAVARASQGGEAGGTSLGLLGFVGLGGLGVALGGLGTTLLAIGASITGLDDNLRALKIADTLVRIGQAIGRAVTRVTKFVDDFVDVFRKLGPVITDIQDVFRKGFAKIPQTVFEFFDKVKANVLTTIPEDIAKVKLKVTEFFKPVTDFFGKVSEFIKPVIQGVGTTVESFGKVFGSILDFFKATLQFIDPLLGPLKVVLNTAMRPFFQIMLSIVDFVIGFYEGFTETSGDFFKKLTAGLEGGVKGVIKGITKAIDLIFIDLPAWIAGKLGFDKVAKKIKEFNITQFVDPIYESIKKFFKDALAGNLSLPPIESFAFIGDTMADIIHAPINILKKAVNGILDGLIAGLTSGKASYIPGSDAAARMFEGMKFDVESSKRNPSTNTTTPTIDASDSRYRPGTIPSIEIDKTGIANAQAAAMESQQQQQMASRGATANTVVQDNSTTVNGGASTALIGQGSNALDPRHAWLSPVG